MMANKGLTKLVEECGELVQIAAKKIAYPDTDTHPDNKGSMKQRLEEEIADVMAASCFVVEKFGLDENKIMSRMGVKVERFKKWDKEK